MVLDNGHLDSNNGHARATVGIYNVGSADTITVKEIAKITASKMRHKGIALKFTGGVDGGRGWKGDVKKMQLSVDKLLNVGWKPKFNREEAVRKTCREILNAAANQKHL